MPDPSTPLASDGPLLIDGPVGRLEVLIAHPLRYASAVAVVCHPHPLHGGTMHNKVVHMLARTFVDLGAHTLRFNFRGVGCSDGAYDHGVGETDDAAAVIEWARARFPDRALWLAGFSFGAYVALRAAGRAAPDRLVTVAPAVNLYDFSVVPTPDCPWWLLQGDADEIVPPQAVRAWSEMCVPAPRQLWFNGVGHFFHGRLNDIRNRLQEAWDSTSALPAID